MFHLATETRSFLRAALVEPTPRDHREPDRAFHRRRIVSVLTLLVGALVLAWSLRIPPGDPQFYVGTIILAGVWALGALASGPLHLGRGWTRSGSPASHAVVQSLALGAVLVTFFLLGAIVVARVPPLRVPVENLLAHAASGRLLAVALITAINAVAEEVYFRGALYAAVGRRHPVLVTTVVYAAVTAASGVALLFVAGVVLGLVTASQRRVTGGILGPVVTHLVWSMSLLLLLPRVFELAR